MRPEDKIEYFINEKKNDKRVKAHVNSQFFKQLKFLLGECLATSKTLDKINFKRNVRKK